MEILPLADIAETWQVLEDPLRDDEWARTPPYYFSEEVVRSG
jgi:hypothetical protein